MKTKTWLVLNLLPLIFSCAAHGQFLKVNVEPVKVLKLEGWRDVKTMMIYVRKAGVDLKGATDVLDLHDPITKSAAILPLKQST